MKYLFIMIIYFRDLKIYFKYCFFKFNKLFVRKIFQGYWKKFFFIFQYLEGTGEKNSKNLLILIFKLNIIYFNIINSINLY